ncbi:uncharacterized protein LOC133716847 [Rosa rugosa]|uniref:uncharacterized protein LOC133716847 n=1 Tax=Rosa rugosa TaxID=74645 RepID=UPI002B40DA9D|nr:uncharacterized protein LOC133716847 [Rosa rugosa]
MAPQKPLSTASTMATQKLTLKLLIDKKEQKVLFAEAGKDFVDFLFSLLSLPLATVAKLLIKDGKMANVLSQDGVRLVSHDVMVGSLFHVYQSVENLGDKYMEPTVNKETLLRSNESVVGLGSLLELLTINPDDQHKASTAKKLYGCMNLNHRGSYITDDPKTICPLCNTYMTVNVAYVPPPVAGRCVGPPLAEAASSKIGYVKDTLTYLVMDDLDVKPLASIISSRHHLMKLFDHELEEKMVHLGMDEGLKMLKALLQSKSVLTDAYHLQLKAVFIMSTFIDAQRETDIFLKLTIDRENRKVLFAEANKDFVDNLVGFMTFPTSAMIKLSPEPFGKLKNVKNSIENMTEYYNPMKASLLNTMPPAHRNRHEHALCPLDPSSLENMPFYVCEECITTRGKPYYVANDPTVLCPTCNHAMTQGASYCGTPSETANEGGGFVLQRAKYIITDDLNVHPLLTASLITRIILGANSQHVEEVTVNVSHKKLVMLELLKKGYAKLRHGVVRCIFLG